MEYVAQQSAAFESNAAQAEHVELNDAPQLLSLAELEQIGGGDGEFASTPTKGW
jgi:hypothetical protein